MRQLTIQRSFWAHATNSLPADPRKPPLAIYPNGTIRLLNECGNFCCLGFKAHLLDDYSLMQLQNKSMPCELRDENDNTEWEIEAIAINDLKAEHDSLDPIEQEKMLEAHFAACPKEEGGPIQLTFVD